MYKGVGTMDDETLKKFGYVNISTYRVKIVKSLKDNIKTPTQISKYFSICISLYRLICCSFGAYFLF